MFIVIFFLLLGGAFGWSLGLGASMSFLVFSTVSAIAAGAAIAALIHREDGTLHWDILLSLASFTAAFIVALWYSPHG